MARNQNNWDWWQKMDGIFAYSSMCTFVCVCVSSSSLLLLWLSYHILFQMFGFIVSILRIRFNSVYVHFTLFTHFNNRFKMVVGAQARVLSLMIFFSYLPYLWRILCNIMCMKWSDLKLRIISFFKHFAKTA